ncbi:MAG: YcxB family protein [Clostridia bacterium]|nr:YcxB family protein [Clostridia bacterium]
MDKHEQMGRLFDGGFYTYRFEENSYACATKSQNTQCTYANLLRVDVGKQALYLYESSLKALILPNRIFASNEEKERFAAFIQWKISEIQVQETQTCCSENAVHESAAQ